MTQFPDTPSPREIIEIPAKKLLGKKLMMSLAHDQTLLLWQSFMPLRNRIPHRINGEVVSLQVYPADYFESFNPAKEFEKWALVEVADYSADTETGLVPFTLQGGCYAVFDHQGPDKTIFTAIYTRWLPHSAYILDNRPHFEVLGETYKPGDPQSRETIWIPVKTR